MKIPSSIPLDREGQYCISCLAETVKRVYKDNLSFYQCSTCDKILERSLVIDNQITWRVDNDGTYWHESTGVIVTKDNKLLVMLRQIYPFAYTIPAGHLDKGELPETAAKRELHEETGITTSSLETLKSGFDLPGDSCRRGCDHHHWHLFRLKLNEYPNIQISDEASIIKWMNLSELQKEPNLTYPLKYFVDNLGAKIFD